MKNFPHGAKYTIIKVNNLWCVLNTHNKRPEKMCAMITNN